MHVWRTCNLCHALTHALCHRNARVQAHGKRKIVIPPAHGYGAAGFTHTTGMTKVVVPPNSTLLFFVELLQAGKYASQRHPEVNHEEL